MSEILSIDHTLFCPFPPLFIFKPRPNSLFPLKTNKQQKQQQKKNRSFSLAQKVNMDNLGQIITLYAAVQQNRDSLFNNTQRELG